MTAFVNPLAFALYQIDDDGLLFISPAIETWQPLEHSGIRNVIDLEGGLDHGVPTLPDHMLYIYFPIFDEGLPDLVRLHAVARLGATLIKEGQAVLSHCGAGFNRSALVAGMILVELGWRGIDAVQRLRDRRSGALFNDVFAEYLLAR
jgi:hypothetical protein